jgi:serine/threonine-protein kinase
MAEVWLAQAHGASGFERKVALKLLLPELREHPRMIRALIEEARLGARLQHRNLVQVHDLAVTEGIYFLRLDYVEGIDLRALLSLARPTPALALLIAEEVALALDYLHRARDDDDRPLGLVHRARDDDDRPLGLVHRDVSPGNILLSVSGEVKLSDYGVTKATMLADVTRAGVVKGTYAYMSPEQVRGVPLDARSDQFALGVTLCELLTGTRPFEGASPLETMERVRAAVPPGLPELDADLRSLLLRCLAREPADRFADERALLGKLDACRRVRSAGPLDLADLIRLGGPRPVSNPSP